ncbi:MAG: hypothetical protein CSA97_04730 [Bacteroidetes bacterium]|nr:MAG: hypothetical protein CSA97_04730 [Bacteroidota bacterium]
MGWRLVLLLLLAFVGLDNAVAQAHPLAEEGARFDALQDTLFHYLHRSRPECVRCYLERYGEVAIERDDTLAIARYGAWKRYFLTLSQNGNDVDAPLPDALAHVQEYSDSLFAMYVYMAQAQQLAGRKESLRALMALRMASTYEFEGMPLPLRIRLLCQSGAIYMEEECYDKAKQLYEEALPQAEEGGRCFLPIILNALARLKAVEGDNLHALALLYRASRIAGDDLSLVDRVHTAILIAEQYLQLGEYGYAARHVQEALELARASGVNELLGQALSVKARLLGATLRIAEARRVATEALEQLELARNFDAYYTLLFLKAKWDSALGDHSEAMECLADYVDWMERSPMGGAPHRFEEQVALLERSIQRNRVQVYRLSELTGGRGKSGTQLLVLGIGLFVLLGLLGYFMSTYRRLMPLRASLRESKALLDKSQHEWKAQNQRIEAQRQRMQQDHAIKLQLKAVLEQSEERMVRSINHMRNIQRSLLPDIQKIAQGFRGAFVLYSPRDVVSGDFYWYAEVGESKIVAVVDCVGHGVPGAMMNLVGNIILNKIVHEWMIYDPAMILELIHQQILDYLGQKEKQDVGHYSMDLTVMRVDLPERQLVVSSASNAFYVVRNGEVERYRGSLSSVGGGMVASNFEDIIIPFEGVSTIYLTSDGIVDQLNEDYRKIGWRRVAAIMEELSCEPVAIQQRVFEELIATHRQGMEQTDDICLLGIQLEAP